MTVDNEPFDRPSLVGSESNELDINYFFSLLT